MMYSWSAVFAVLLVFGAVIETEGVETIQQTGVNGSIIFNNTELQLVREVKSSLEDKTKIVIKDYGNLADGKGSSTGESTNSLLEMFKKLTGLPGKAVVELEKKTIEKVKKELGPDRVSKLEKKYPSVKKFLGGEEFDKYECNCIAFGDPHLYTFDKKYYTLSETGNYLLVNTNGKGSSDPCAFRIAIKSGMIKDKKIPYVTEAIITFKKFKQPISIKNNQGKSSLVVPPEIKASLDISAFKHTSEDGHGYIRVANPTCKINVIYGHASIVVSVGRKEFGGRMAGLCGDCDGDKTNDRAVFQPETTPSS
ncbi:uncharacterized protein LOC141911273 [Tubulanus polymorphus]|uniref:uncharacterized protein LOC141911273 n=1 Tax=Tubulanus polymorphus TaxID=672921 RepID=UPI003DA26DD6